MGDATMETILDEYKKFEQGLNHAISEALLLDVAEELVKHIQASVQENVYDKYAPSKYVRRGKGDSKGSPGLQSEKSYDRYVDATGTELTIENITTGNPAYRPPKSEGWDSGNIGDYIEAGDGYHWTRSDIYNMMPYPRPFMEPALEKALADGSVEVAFVEGLKKRGFE